MNAGPLLDTHTLLWWLDGDRRLSRRARLPEPLDVATDVAGCLARQDFLELPISVLHAQRAGTLRIDHRDPFDRMLIAQAQMEDLPIVTNETLFDAFGITRIW
ncbi:MAG: type II toxin-antitoxin system VapC family toxin [Acidobacteriota bacterium]